MIVNNLVGNQTMLACFQNELILGRELTKDEVCDLYAQAYISATRFTLSGPALTVTMFIGSWVGIMLTVIIYNLFR